MVENMKVKATKMVRPRNDQVLIKQIEEDEYVGKVIIVENRQARQFSKGVVIAVGPGRLSVVGQKVERFPVDIEVGDKVLFMDHAGIPVMHNEAPHLLVPEREIYCNFE